MIFKVAQCPRCGGDLGVRDAGETVRCVYCGGTVIIERSNLSDHYASQRSDQKRLRTLKEGPMPTSEAAELQRKWAGKSCPHEVVMREYYFEVKTGDCVCITCGEAFAQIRVNCPGCDLPVSWNDTSCPQCNELIARP